jgi:hypothetical protein
MPDRAAARLRQVCTQITGFTGTKVQMLTARRLRQRLQVCTQITGFTGTKVQMLTARRLRQRLHPRTQCCGAQQRCRRPAARRARLPLRYVRVSSGLYSDYWLY